MKTALFQKEQFSNLPFKLNGFDLQIITFLELEISDLLSDCWNAIFCRNVFVSKSF